MTLNPDNVSSAITGAAYVAPLGTTAPTDPTTAWAAGWVDLGYISEDGLSEAESRDWNTITAWQNRAVVRRLLTGAAISFTFTVIENKREAVELRHAGSTVATTTGVHRLEIFTPTDDIRAFGFDVVDVDDHHRIILPRGSVTDVTDITYKNGDAIGYGFTVEAYPSSSGLVAIKLSDKASWAEAA